MIKNIDYVMLGKRIKDRRNELKITQEQLGEICELSSAHIGHIERGTRVLSVDVLCRISSALNVSVDYLLFDSIDDNNLLKSISEIIKSSDKLKQKQFLNTIKVLADNIDKI